MSFFGGSYFFQDFYKSPFFGDPYFRQPFFEHMPIAHIVRGTVVNETTIQIITSKEVVGTLPPSSFLIRQGDKELTVASISIVSDNLFTITTNEAMVPGVPVYGKHIGAHSDNLGRTNWIEADNQLTVTKAKRHAKASPNSEPAS